MTSQAKERAGLRPDNFAIRDKPQGKRSSAGWSWLRLIAYCFIAFVLSAHLHYKLPTPKTHRGVDPETGAVEFSERNAVETISYLSDTLGYRKY